MLNMMVEQWWKVDEYQGTSGDGALVRNGKVLSLRGSYTWLNLTRHARGAATRVN